MKTSLRVFAAAAAVVGFQAVAFAGSIWHVDFTLTIEQVLPAAEASAWDVTVGELFHGSFCYDDENVKDSGMAFLYTDGHKSFGGSFPQIWPLGLLDIRVGVQGSVYTAPDDGEYGDSPLVVFEDGVLRGIQFMPRIGDDWLIIYPEKFAINSYGPVFGADLDLARGSISYSTPQPCEIPTPTTAAAALALLPLLVSRRRVRG